VTQLALPFSSSPKCAPQARPKRTAKPHHRPKADGPLLPLFLPLTVSPGRAKVKLPVYKHPGYSKEIVRDALVPCEAEIDVPFVSVLVATAALVSSSPWFALVALVAYTESRRVYVRYRAARVLEGTFTPVDWVPATRAQCPSGRAESGCPHVYCRQHLWTVPIAGRPGLASVPRNEKGLTISVMGELARYREQLRLEPRWLALGTMPASCALDVAERGKGGNQHVGHATGRHRTLAAREIKSAVRKACSTAEDVYGMDPEDLIAALMKMGDRPRES
jgi:hypothetical protein